MPDDPKSESPDNRAPNPDMAKGDAKHHPVPEEHHFLPLAYFLIFFLGAPTILFFYMVFYFVWPEPLLFEKSFIYSIFPNLAMEHAYLSRIGREEFANNFVNYQANMVFLCVIINFPLYIIFFPLFILKSSQRKFIPWRMILYSSLFCIMVYMYLFGVWPLDRIGGHNKLVIDGKDDYFFLWFFLTTWSFFFNAGIFLLLYKVIYRVPATSDSGK